VITELVPERRMVLEGDVGPLSGTLSYQIEEVPEGTRLTNSADLSGRGPLRLLAPLAASRVRDAVAANLDKLRDLLESSP
jgi:Polyketide cyclase / dehydrase and lipid transport